MSPNVKFKLYILGAAVSLVVLGFGLVYIASWRLGGDSDFSDIAERFSSGKEFSFGITSPSSYNEPLKISLAGQEISIAPLGAAAARAESAGDNVVKYVDAYPNTDVVQTRYSNKIKEDIILKQPGHPEIFEYQLDLASFDFSKDQEGNLVFYQKGHRGDDFYKRFSIPAPYLIDADGKKSSPKEVAFELENNGRLILKPNAQWLAQAKYPVILDPTVEITILNVHSHPQQGENWTVEFTTQGQADLKIIPNDQATIDDDEFVSLSCGTEKRQPQILAGDVIYFHNWSCDQTATVIHYTKKAGKHTLRFEFGGQVAYAYNTSYSPVVFRTAKTDVYTKLLIHADEASGSTSLVDSASVPKTITAAGNASTTNAQTKFSNVAAFDGSGDYLSLADSADWDFVASNSDNLTLDFWVRHTDHEGTERYITQQETTSKLWSLYHIHGSGIQFVAENSGIIISTPYAGEIFDTNWHHLAVVKEGNVYKVYKDGIEIASTTDSDTVAIAGSLYIGQNGNNANYFDGYIDEIRVSKGIARWTTAFTPPTAPYYVSPGSTVVFRTAKTDIYTKLLIHADEASGSTSLVDSASVPKTITAAGNASTTNAQTKFSNVAAFDGSGDYLSLADSDDWYFGTGDFTIDVWLYVSILPNLDDGYSFYDQQDSTTSRVNLYLYRNPDDTRKIVIYARNGADILTAANVGVGWTINTWYHIAFVRSGNTFTTYWNGSSVASVTQSMTMPNSSVTLKIGTQWDASCMYWNGYIDEFRISKGIARWTSNFTPPTAPYGLTGSTVIFK